VHIVRPDARAVGGSFFQMKGSVTDRIKADFNTDKRDRFFFAMNLCLKTALI
jgi:trafficking protein particle complex subunit 10